MKFTIRLLILFTFFTTPLFSQYSSLCQEKIEEAVDVFKKIHDVKTDKENKKLSIDYRTNSGLYDFDFHFIDKNIGIANLATNEWGRPNLVYKWKDDEGNVEKVDVYYFPTYEDYVMFVEPTVISACSGEYESTRYSKITRDEKLFVFRKGERVEAGVKVKLYRVESNVLEKDNIPHKKYYNNGNLREEGQLKNGQGNGEWKYYYENGQLKSVGNYENGKKTGEWKYYLENGNLTELGKYENDKKVGEWKTYH